jgi:glutamine synthetase adenylyltransferase
MGLDGLELQRGKHMRKIVLATTLAFLATVHASARAEEAKGEAKPADAAAKEPEKKEEKKEEKKDDKKDDKKDEKVSSFAEALKRSDPDAYKRFSELSEARDKNLADLKKIQAEMKTATSEEKINLYQQFRIARKKYAQSYIAFIDFLDERDKKGIEKYQEAIKRLEGVLEKRKKAREELEKALKEE